MVGDLAPHEAFPIGGTNSVRGYDEGAVGSGRSYVVASGEVSFPLVSGAMPSCIVNELFCYFKIKNGGFVV